jgi:hypothetical protein
MTPTNNQIYTALINLLHNATLGYPVAYPGYNFTPPDTGVWLEVMFMPNRGIAYDTGNTEEVTPQGLFQVTVYDRPGNGVNALDTAAEAVKAVFPKGTAIAGTVRVQEPPYFLSLDAEGGMMMKVVTIPYSG